MSEKTKILIAEHDQTDIELTLEELRKNGISYISEIVDTEAGYNRALEEFMPDIILSDYTFPAFSGPMAFRIRENIAPLTPFIFVSGTIGEDKSIELIKNGVTDFVLKENLFSLSGKVDRALKDSKVRREKNKATEKLRQTMNELGKIMDSTVDIICSIDEFGKFVKINNAVKEMWGYSPEELSGQPFINFVCAEDHAKTIEAAKGIMSGMITKNFENRYRRKNGSLVTVSWSARWDNDDKLMYCIAKDTTAKKKAEEILEIERQRFFDLFLKAPTSICVLKGPTHVFEMANSMYMTMIGRQDIIGKPANQVLPELQGQGFIDMLNEVYKSGVPFEANELLVKLDQHEDGNLTDTYLNLVCQAYRNRTGVIEGVFSFAENVTAQVVSRLKTEESERRFRQIVETAQEGIWLIDENDYTTFINKKMSDIIGYSIEEVIGKKIYHFMDEESSRASLIQIEKRKKGLSEIHDSVFLNKNNDSVWTSVSTNPVFDEAGNYKGALAMISDITEKRKTAQQMGWLINNTEESFVLMDQALNIISFNDQAKRTYLQYFHKEIIVGENIFTYVLPDRMEIARDIYKSVLKGNEETAEIIVPQPNGEIKNFRLRYKPAKNEHGYIIGAFLSLIDITEKKRAEILKEFERRDKEALINSTTDLIWSVSSDFKLIAANNAFIVNMKNSAGIDLKPGDNLLVGDIFSPEFISYWKQTYETALAGESLVKEIYVGESEHQPESWRETILNPIYDGSIITGIACYSKNISEQKKSEVRLKKLNEHLQQQAKELAVSNADLEQFAYVASHDLQEPLRMITSFLSLLEKKYGDHIDEKGKSYIAFAVDGAKRMRHIILDLLEFSRIGRIGEQTEKIDLNEVVKEVLILFRKKVQEKNAVITLDQLPEIYAEAAPMRQVFQNLISNALKYSNTGVTVQIHISARQLQNQWEFSIKDNGIGIDPEYYERIFVIFQRLHNKDEFSGTGIGLSITKKIIENKGGKIWVTSRLGEGSTFFFTLLATPD